MAELCVGILGCGNMGGAILKGLAATGKYSLIGWTRTMKRLDPLLEMGVEAATDANDLVRKSSVLILGVKPYQIEDVIESLDKKLLSGKILVSIAAGTSLKTLKKAADNCCTVVRCMPNTPAMVSRGVFALCFDKKAGEKEKECVKGIFADLGLCLELTEEQFTPFSALIGAGPAYVFDLMEGLVMAGVTLGFSHAQSRSMVTELFAGCAKMAAENPAEHLMAMRDNVCSPAGLTIAGVNAMNEEGLSAKLGRAVLKANERGREMED